MQRFRNNVHLLFALYGMLRYGRSYRRLIIIGITGTDGKSSTVILTARLLRAAGKRVAHYSSVSVHDGLLERPNVKKMTMPGRAGAHAFLARAVKNGCDLAVIEATSEAILQWRHFGIPFDVVAFTNITPEHIERHGTFTSYVRTKLSLCKNLRDHHGYGMVVWNCVDTELQKHKKFFNKYKQIGVPVTKSESAQQTILSENMQMAEAILNALQEKVIPLRETDLNIRGRFELLGHSPQVLIDYAHTPHAVEMCLAAARKLCTGRLIHVFGAAGGGRDTWKRPILAQLSERYADIHILTEENSFDEPIANIIADIQKGFTKTTDVHVAEKREDAVQRAFAIAEDNDLIVLTAKGSEEVIAGPQRSMRPYNERTFVQTCLCNLH